MLYNHGRPIVVHRIIAGLQVVRWHNIARWPKGRVGFYDAPVTVLPEGMSREPSARELREWLRGRERN